MADTVVHEPRHHRPHPKPKDYWLIALILAVITAAEVAASYMSFLGDFVIPVLIIMAVAKFAIVALWFMHLRFDKKVYTRYFVVGIIGAVAMFTVVLFTFGAFIGD